MTRLYMVSMALDIAALRAKMAQRGIPADEGLALHHFLSETFGKGIIQPFRLMPGRRKTGNAVLYGYSVRNRTDLLDSANTFAVPEILKIFDLNALETKIMPTIFDSGKRLGFDVRVRPVRRLKSPLKAESREVRRDQMKGKPVKPVAAGSEVDAFLLERLRSNPTLVFDGPAELPTREQVYLTWLAKRFGSAVELDPKTSRVNRYVRRTVWRGGKAQDGPDATVQGELLVKDPQRFSQLVARGVGRHTAYGYGMLLLRPPGR